MMKNKNIYLIGMFAFCFCLSACSDEDCLSGQDGTGEADREISIVVSTAGYPVSRSTETGFEVGDSIGIFVTKRSEESVVTALKASSNYGSNVKWVKTEEGWVPATGRDKLNFPADGSPLDFYAYYPYNRNFTNPLEMVFEVKADQSTKSGLSASDLMMAVNEAGVTEGKVNLVFKHQLSMVNVEFINGKVSIGKTPKGKISGVATAAKLDWSARKVSAVTGVKKEVMMMRTAAAGYHYSVIVPAQTASPLFYCIYGADSYRHIGTETGFLVGEKKEFILTFEN